jgi:hypothetical protein
MQKIKYRCDINILSETPTGCDSPRRLFPTFQHYHQLTFSAACVQLFLDIYGGETPQLVNLHLTRMCVPSPAKRGLSDEEIHLVHAQDLL